MTPSEFFSHLRPAAVVSGLPTSFVLAQAALESGWGASQLASVGNNYFGIKAGRDWAGPILTIATREFENGMWNTVDANWRKYASVADGIADYVQFFHDNPRYRKALACTSGKDFAKAVAAAGYATDPDYADKICKIIDQYNLEGVPMVSNATKSTDTAIVGGGVSAVTEAANWLLNVKFNVGAPPGVLSLIATVLISCWHAFYNKKLAPSIDSPSI
jgi:flagellum-specific peptidoglycan hydrolase FlgJ